MFVEQRLYTCAPGQTGEFLKVYEQEGRAPQIQHLGQPVGYYISEIGMLNQVTTLWAYGSLDERVERRRALFQNPDWKRLFEQGTPAADAAGTAHSGARALLPGTAGGDREPRERAMMARRIARPILALACAAFAPWGAGVAGAGRQP